MKSQEIIRELKKLSSDKHKANVVRMGIPADTSLGVSIANLRKLAKEIKKSNSLAYQLWNTGYHEAKLLAVLIFEKDPIDIKDVEKLMNSVISWDLCDHLCKNLIIKQPYYNKLILSWINSSHTYKKRASFVLMASSLIHDKDLLDSKIDEYLDLIYEYSKDDHEHVKKSISWALREIGKKNFTYNEKALILAYELKATGDKNQVWIGKSVIKELEKVVKISERKRLISTDRKMGKID
ncbi:MAG: DNA alkylation repair protein [Epulopiscium sp.]|nr:DNA alkylation repair protein [Candidatus Epulonipiscium sp.]